jgi:sterol desaturase/sphingolipid hydroxylase (fatty acid hydroxylase superfamily)
MRGVTPGLFWSAVAAVAATGAAFLLFLLYETLRPLRKQRESKLRRVARNLTAGGIALAVVTLLQTPLLVPVARWVSRRHFGLFNRIELPRPVAIALVVVLLDYTLWIWHRLNHVVPFFWRFHLVHHVDRDMDASTAFRFHFGEQALSVGYRILQVAVLGADPLSLWIWQGLLSISIVFHHSNSRLPLRLERVLCRIVVTPRMHGIHHSNYRNEANGNWSSLLSAWDYLHGTVLLGVPQDSIEIGVPAYGRREDVTIGQILVMPFRWQREDWVGEDGPRRERPHDLAQKLELAE